MVFYRMYIDENGNPDMKSSDDPNHRFLNLTGVIVDLDYAGTTLSPEMEALKAKHLPYHPDDPPIFHRTDMVNCRPPFDNLRDEKKRGAFDIDFKNMLNAWNYRVITVLIDKRAHREKYIAHREYPYHYCLEVLLERYVKFLRRTTSKGDVMAESRGATEDRLLKNEYNKIWRDGASFESATNLQTSLSSKQLKVRPKIANVAGLQLADIVGHPSRCEILDTYGLLGRPLAPFATEVISILQHKYDHVGSRNYGKKFLP
ncbi:MAG: DUF3800 domain-containing protein [Candidatus Aquicultor sp.]|nr:DUF3800 domain-containing protein [Candidatus Aquicultor sp.]